MIKKSLPMAVALAAVALLSGCLSSPSPRQPPRTLYNSNAWFMRPADADIRQETYVATETLLANAAPVVAPKAPILVASLVDIDNVERSSTLGRMLSEIIASRLTQMGYPIGEVTLRGAIAVRPDAGELILSRDLNQIRTQYDAQAVVAGTYAVGGKTVHIDLKLIRPNDGRVLSAVNYALPLGPDTAAMVANPP